MTFVVEWFYVYWFSTFRYWLNVKDSRIQLKMIWRKFIRCLEIRRLQCWRWKRDTCLQQRGWATPALEWSTGAGAAPRGAYRTPQKPELHMGVFTPKGPELHLDLSEQQKPVLLLDLYNYRGLCCTLTCLHCRGLCCSWSCLHHSTGVWAAPGHI